MASSIIKLDKIKLDVSTFGSEGSAVLGIRGSGKTYTATLLAERLFDAGVPFVAFDPIGVWRYLRVPGKGHGYPIVVAGGQAGDLPLSPAGAPKIIEAAMQNGVSLVIDLFDIKLSKADWRRIVGDGVRTLLHRNSEHGLRHVFLEEAAEFAPQKVTDGIVYAEIEKLARMGGNSRLGYTLINQRAEEVNKAVLELCDNLFLHRQKGRNSLTALGKWLDIGNVSDSKAIMETMATLPTGECWAWIGRSDVPIRIKVPAKNSLHPDRQVMRTLSGKGVKAIKPVDVSSFVSRLQTTLPAIEQEAADNDPAKLRAEIARLKRELTGKGKVVPAPAVDVKAIRSAAYAEGAQATRKAIAPLVERLVTCTANVAKQLEVELPAIAANNTPRVSTINKVKAAVDRQLKPLAKANGASAGDESLTNPQQRIVDAVLWLESIGVTPANKDTVAFLAGASSTSGGYFNNLGRLRVAGFIDYPSAGMVALTDDGRQRANSPENAATLADLHDAVRRKLPAPMVKILDELIACHPAARSKEELANSIGVSPTSGGYFNNLGRLRTFGLVDYPAAGQVQATKVLFPDGLH